MLRGENIVCGTTTTGTGTLTLAATPGPPGGVDFDVLARATGVGFANSAAVLVSYTIMEYTDTTFATAKSMEKGIGTLTLGGSSGIANCTLARTTVQVKATSLNSQPATYSPNAPTAFSVGTAANTLVFIGPSPCDLPAWGVPYYETGVGDNLGVFGLRQAPTAAQTLTNGEDAYSILHWLTPMLVKKASARVVAAYTGGTTNLYVAIYAIATNGRPGKLLIDFGALGTAGSALNSGNTNISSAVHTTGFFLTPGRYILDVYGSFTGGSGSPSLSGISNNIGHENVGELGATNFAANIATHATGAATPAPDPANTTGYAGITAVGSGSGPYYIALSPS